MRRLASVSAVAAVVAVGAAAAVDSLRGRAASIPTGLSGELVYADADCHRHAVRLPGLERRDFLTVGCGVFSRRDNLGVKDGVVAWFAYPVPGGTTTLLHNPSVRQVAWLGGRRFAATVAGGGLAIWEGERLLHQLAPGAYRELRASPEGKYFAALSDAELAVFDRDGRPIAITQGQAIAWSPGERFAAVARGDEVVIVPAAGGDSVLRIRLSAADLDWRRGG